MHYYLLHKDSTWSDLAEYTELPKPRGDGTWMQGYPVKLQHHTRASLQDAIFHAYHSYHIQLPCDTYGHLKDIIQREIQNNYIDIVRAIIKGLATPEGFEPLREELLTVIDNYLKDQ